MTRSILILLCLAWIGTLGAAGFAEANAAYEAQDYDRAVALYDSLLATDADDPDLFYNMGNAHYRAGDLGRAILFYERTLNRAPAHRDARFNLEIARADRIDVFDPPAGVLIARRLSRPFQRIADHTLAWGGVVAVWIAIAGLALLLTGSSGKRRRTGLGVAVTFTILSIALLVGSLLVRSGRLSHERAVVLADSAYVKSAPSDGGANLLLVHAGSTARLLDRTADWSKLRFSDGTIGWMHVDAVEPI